MTDTNGRMTPPAAGKIERSPRYASIGPTEALEYAKRIWTADKRNPVSPDMACQHMGYKAKNGASQVVLASLKQYGLLVSVGSEVKITDDAHSIFLAPDSEPERYILMRKVAMRPELFGKVLDRFPDGLPSDANLRYRLMQEFGFVNEKAADNFIASLKDAVALRDKCDVALGSHPADTVAEVNATEQPAMTPTPAITPTMPTPAPNVQSRVVSPPPAVAGPQERHVWKLAGNTWAEVTITGSLGPKSFEKLKKYVDLIDVADSDEAA